MGESTEILRLNPEILMREAEDAVDIFNYHAVANILKAG